MAAHSLLRHGVEKHSIGILKQFARKAEGPSPTQTQTALTQRQESEADYTGLLLMAQAGYDPREAVGVLERMQRLEEKQPPEQQASYPTRIKRLEGWLDEALTYYKPPPGLEVRDLPHVSTP